MRFALATGLAILVCAPAWAARPYSAREPYTYVQDRPFSPAESAKRIGALTAAPGVTVRKRVIATINGREMHAVTKSKRASRITRPLGTRIWYVGPPAGGR